MFDIIQVALPLSTAVTSLAIPLSVLPLWRSEPELVTQRIFDMQRVDRLLQIVK